MAIDITAKDDKGRSALHSATEEHVEGVLKRLLESAGDQKADMNAKDDGGKTALHSVTNEGMEELVRGCCRRAPWGGGSRRQP